MHIACHSHKTLLNLNGDIFLATKQNRNIPICSYEMTAKETLNEKNKASFFIAKEMQGPPAIPDKMLANHMATIKTYPHRSHQLSGNAFLQDNRPGLHWGYKKLVFFYFRHILLMIFQQQQQDYYASTTATTKLKNICTSGHHTIGELLV